MYGLYGGVTDPSGGSHFTRCLTVGPVSLWFDTCVSAYPGFLGACFGLDWRSHSGYLVYVGRTGRVCCSHSASSVTNLQLKMGKCHISQNIKIGYVIKHSLLADVQTTKLKIALSLIVRGLNFIFS